MTFSQGFFDMLERISSLQSDDLLWFRGHNKDSYKLNSGLFRLNFDKLGSFLGYENNAYYYVKDHAHLHHKSDGWDLLYLMQHHQMKTRLLDWTTSFATALYFAFLGWNPDQGSAHIWMLKPLEMNRLSLGSPTLVVPEVDYSLMLKRGRLLMAIGKETEPRPIKNSFALFPKSNNGRIIAQQGVFTFQNNMMYPLEDELFNRKNLVDEGILEKFVLPPEWYEQIKSFLNLMGVNHYVLFPDMDGLAKHLDDMFLKNNPVLGVSKTS